MVLVDDQNRGDGYILAAYAITGDEALADDLLDSIAVDETRAFPRRGWIDAPRATAAGRRFLLSRMRRSNRFGHRMTVRFWFHQKFDEGREPGDEQEPPATPRDSRRQMR